jgi:hypothetical protein
VTFFHYSCTIFSRQTTILVPRIESVAKVGPVIGGRNYYIINFNSTSITFNYSRVEARREKQRITALITSRYGYKCHLRSTYDWKEDKFGTPPSHSAPLSRLRSHASFPHLQYGTGSFQSAVSSGLPANMNIDCAGDSKLHWKLCVHAGTAQRHYIYRGKNTKWKMGKLMAWEGCKAIK